MYLLHDSYVAVSHGIEGCACEFVVPEGAADLITFSYSLSSE
jgi:hypothetical protein